jgi:hypothetical protein
MTISLIFYILAADLTLFYTYKHCMLKMYMYFKVMLTKTIVSLCLPLVGISFLVPHQHIPPPHRLHGDPLAAHTGGEDRADIPEQCPRGRGGSS